MNVAPQDCLVIEDSVAGIEAANAAGMSSIQFCGSSQPFHTNFIHAYEELDNWVSTALTAAAVSSETTFAISVNLCK